MAETHNDEPLKINNVPLLYTDEEGQRALKAFTGYDVNRFYAPGLVSVINAQGHVIGFADTFDVGVGALGIVAANISLQKECPERLDVENGLADLVALPRVSKGLVSETEHHLDSRMAVGDVLYTLESIVLSYSGPYDVRCGKLALK